MDLQSALLRACGSLCHPCGPGSFITGAEALRGARQRAPSLALPIPEPLANVEGVKQTPVTSVQELSNDVEAFFVHLRDNCTLFNDGTQQGKDSLQRIYASLSEIFHGDCPVTDADHIDYLSKALQYLRHSSFSNPNMGFGVQKNCPWTLAGEFARFFQAGETHATRAATVVEHLIKQSRYFYQTLNRSDYRQLNQVLTEYACDSGPINDAISGSSGATPAAREAARILLTVLQDPRLPGIKGPFTLYRGIGSKHWTEGGPQSISTSLFHSTTTDPEVMRRFAAKGQWLIQIPEGATAPVVAMAQILVRHENEFVLGPSIFERTHQLSNGSSEESPAYVYRYGGPVMN